MRKGMFDEIMKSKLQSFEKAPPTGSFEKIKANLANKPTDKKPLLLPSYVKYGVAASLAFLLGLFTMNTYHTQKLNTLSLTKTVESAAITKESVPELIAESIEPIKEVQKAFQSTSANVALSAGAGTIANQYSKVSMNVVASQASKLVINNNKSSKNEEESNFLFKDDKVMVDVSGMYASNSSKENLSFYALSNFQNNSNDGIEVVKVDNEYVNTRFESHKNHQGYKGFWFGPNISFEMKSIAKTTFLGNGLGLDFGYGFSPVVGLQSGIKYSMLIKDFKLQDNEGKNYHELVNFNSLTIPLAVKFKKSYFAGKIERPASVNTYLGMDYSRLTSINRNQLGGHLGIEYDLFLRPELMISFGAKAGLSSILNYSPTQEYLQANYQPFNYNFGVYTTLRFLTPSKYSK